MIHILYFLFFIDLIFASHSYHGGLQQELSNVQVSRGFDATIFSDNIKGEEVTQKQVESPDFDLSETILYGKKLYNQSFSIELTGYFLAETTGIYSFSLRASTGASLHFGFDEQSSKHTRFPTNDQPDYETLIETDHFDLFLQAGTYYPIKIVSFVRAISKEEGAFLDFHFKTPSGEVVSDADDHIFQLTYGDGQPEVVSSVSGFGPKGCRGGERVSTGFNALLLSYPFRGYEGYKDTFFSSDYLDHDRLERIESVSRINFDFFNETSYTNLVLYGKKVNGSKFGLSLNGFFEPNETGDFEFSICSNGCKATFGVGKDAQELPSELPYQLADSYAYSNEVRVVKNLDAKEIYPIRVNLMCSYPMAMLNLFFKTPSGTILEDVGKHVYQISGLDSTTAKDSAEEDTQAGEDYDSEEIDFEAWLDNIEGDSSHSGKEIYVESESEQDKVEEKSNKNEEEPQQAENQTESAHIMPSETSGEREEVESISVQDSLESKQLPEDTGSVAGIAAPTNSKYYNLLRQKYNQTMRIATINGSSEQGYRETEGCQSTVITPPNEVGGWKQLELSQSSSVVTPVATCTASSQGTEVDHDSCFQNRVQNGSSQDLEADNRNIQESIISSNISWEDKNGTQYSFTQSSTMDMDKTEHDEPTPVGTRPRTNMGDILSSVQTEMNNEKDFYSKGVIQENASPKQTVSKLLLMLLAMCSLG